MNVTVTYGIHVMLRAETSGGPLSTPAIAYVADNLLVS